MYHEWYAKRIKAAKARLRRIKILQHKRRMKLLHTNSRLSSLTKKRTPLFDITSPFLNQQPNFGDSSTVVAKIRIQLQFLMSNSLDNILMPQN
jgi:hypothetical protein